MAGRNHPYSWAPPYPSRPSPGEDHRAVHHQAEQAHPPRAHPSAVIEAQQREIQTLIVDNQRLAATHVALKQELAAADDELRHLSSTAAAVESESDARVREVFEKSVKMEAERRTLDGLSAELAQVKSDIQKMTADSKELASKLSEVSEDLDLILPEFEQLPAIEDEIEAMQKEIQRGRAAIEFEKKMQARNLEQSEIMEKYIVSVAHEIEILHAELENAEKRARAAAAAAATAVATPGYANPEAGYRDDLYSDRYPMQQVQAGINDSPQYGAGGVPHVPNGHYDMQRSNVHR